MISAKGNTISMNFEGLVFDVPVVIDIEGLSKEVQVHVSRGHFQRGVSFIDENGGMHQMGRDVGDSAQKIVIKVIDIATKKPKKFVDSRIKWDFPEISDNSNS